MNYIEYHNAQADVFALRYYSLKYDALTAFMQMVIDDQITTEWMDIAFIDRKNLQK